MSVSEAIKGAWADVCELRNPQEKIRRIGQYTRILGSEIIGIVSMIPYACRSYALYHKLPRLKVSQDGLTKTDHPASRFRVHIDSLDEIEGNDMSHTVRIAADLKYGDRERNVMDVYLPPVDNDKESIHGNRPVLLLCHGGVWATGSKLHYTPIATRLAQAGIVCCLMEYSLYPKAKTDTMVCEVNKALDFLFANSKALCGDPENITLAGHSAGAHLCALALLKRIEASAKGVKTKLPRQFAGLCGVYHIARHFEYEKGRGVEKLSTMERAIGGMDKFSVNSPTVILRSSYLKGIKHAKIRDSHMKLDPAASNFATELRLHGDIIAQRAGIYAVCGPSDAQLDKIVHNSESEYHSECQNDYVYIPPEEARSMPPIFLLASSSDTTVPWHESSELYWMLRSCGMHQCRLLLYNRVGHGDFVVDWHALSSKGMYKRQTSTTDLAPFASDLVTILTRD